MYHAPRYYHYPGFSNPYVYPNYVHSVFPNYFPGYMPRFVPFHDFRGQQEPAPVHSSPQWKDYGLQPFVVNIEKAAKQNNNYRTALWTGKHFQVTLMSINAGDDIGLEVHPHTDQFLRIEEGEGIAQMGSSKEKLDFEKKVYEDDAIIVPAGTWHNVINTGHTPLKLYVIYAPPEHPFGTIHQTKAAAAAAETMTEPAL